MSDKFKAPKNVIILNHPLLQHKITLLRDENTGTNEFRQLVKEIAVMEGYEALRDLPTELVRVKTPIEVAEEPMISGKKLCFVPILRAGLGMVEGMLELVPSAKVGHIGLYRDEVTHKPHEYYCKLPFELEKRDIFVLDPMLATGGSAIDAVSLLKKKGAKNITFICIIGAPEGVTAFTKAFPNVKLYVGAMDRCLNANAYICPGLGDAGDRIFGTVK
jgi:uracil phosphoribosyltransferase